MHSLADLSQDLLQISACSLKTIRIDGQRRSDND
jgi:hypothetical protein